MAPDFQLWQLVTYAFLHGGLLHLFFNMFVLWMFGTQMEYTWGSRRFLFYYFFCVVGAGLTQLAVVSSGSADGIYPTIGASGGVFGILLAFGMRFPNQYILLLIPPIPMKAKYFVLIIGAITLYFGMSGTAGGIAHFAHLGGMIAGLVLILYWRGHLPFKPRNRMRWPPLHPFESFYYIGGLTAPVLYGIAVAQLAVEVAFVLGIARFWTYGFVLITHGLSTLSSWQQYLDPFNHMMFLAAIPMLGACFVLFLLRDQDTRFALGR